MKVKYIGASNVQVKWGGNDDPRGILNEGQLYEVAKREVHSWHTKLILVDFPDLKFNSASFEEGVEP